MKILNTKLIVNTTNIKMTLRVIEKMAHMYKDHPAVWGLEPVNEAVGEREVEELAWLGGHLVAAKAGASGGGVSLAKCTFFWKSIPPIKQDGEEGKSAPKPF